MIFPVWLEDRDRARPSGPTDRLLAWPASAKNALMLAVEVDAVDLVVRRLHEKHLAAGVARRPAGVVAVLRPPVATFHPGRMMSRTRGALGPACTGSRPIFPEIAHRFPEIIVIAGDVPAVDDPEEVVVTGKSQGLVHFLIEQEPVAGAVFHVAACRW